MNQRVSRSELVTIDVDGSGPLAAFPVTCVVTPEGQVETHLQHDSLGDQMVDGFERRGSFVKDVRYDADMRQVCGGLGRGDVGVTSSIKFAKPT